MWRIGIVTAALGFGGLSWAAEEEATVPGRVEASDVYVRSGASMSHERLGKLQKGDAVRIYRRLGDWLEIAVPDRFDLFISAKYVDVQGEMGIVTGDRVNVRPGADAKAGLPMGQCRKGDRLAIRRKVGEWYAVAPPSRTRAYVFAKFVTAEGTVPAAAAKPAPSAPGTTPARPVPAVAERPEARPEPSRFRKTPDARLREGTAALIEELKKPLAQWQFARVREILTPVATDGAPQDRADAQRLLAEVESLEKLRAGEQAIRDIETRRQALEEELVRLPGPETGGSGERPGRYLAVGWVVDQGVFLGRHGTHKLVQGNQTRYYLLSNTYDLDGYINRRIGIVKGRVERLPEGSGADLIAVEELEVLGK